MSETEPPPEPMPPAEATNRHPDCPNEPAACRITAQSSVMTKIAWEPVVDGAGTQVNADPNTVLTVYTCATCAGVWQQTRTGNDVVTTVNAPARSA